MSDVRKVFYIDVGDMPAEEVASYVTKVTSEIKEKQSVLKAIELTANALSGIAPLV